MGIKFTCPHCKNALNVKSNLAGKRGRCPKCDGKIDIPSEDAATSAAAPKAATPVSQAIGQPASSAGVTSQPVGSPSAEAVPLIQEEANPAIIPAAAAVPVAERPDPISEAPQLQWYVMPPGASSQYGPAAGDAFRGWIK